MDNTMRFSSFVVKVASRCNLNCDYCYMYQHVDQTWKEKPKVLSERHRQLFIERLREYALLRKLDRILIVFHGGEPLLFGADNLIQWSIQLSNALAELGCKVDFGIQTNGVLLKEKYLEEFEKHKISVSLSIDGPKSIHDRHRLDIKNKPTFEKVYEALLLLKKYPSIFTGCISVIDPDFDPYELLNFYHDNGVKEFNILIPDANHQAQPKGRDKSPDLYKNWLIRAFDLWFDEFSHMKCKFFDELLLGIMGKSTNTDSFGLGDISMLVLETDGTYHNHDVLKITESNTSSLGLSLDNNTIAEAEISEKILFHRHLLRKEGLSTTCLSCKHVDICGGGFIAHRYDKNGYKNPTVYCTEMYSLIDHIVKRVYSKLVDSKSQGQSKEWDMDKMEKFWKSDSSHESIEELREHRALKNFSKLQSIILFFEAESSSYSPIIRKCKQLSFNEVKTVLLEPAVHAWVRAMYAHANGTSVLNIDGKELPLDKDYFCDFYNKAILNRSRELIFQSNDRWIQFAMGKNIVLNHATHDLDIGMKNLAQAFVILKDYDYSLYDELLRVNSVIQLVRDLSAHKDKDVSFSDETLPGAIFLSVWNSDGLINPYVVAASLIHEHLHQKLYLLMNRFQLFRDETTLVYSPWAQVLRPPHGVLHAVYVFCFVAKFWNTVLSNNLVDESYASLLETLLVYLGSCLEEIKQKVKFTTQGLLFFELVQKEFDVLSQNHSLVKN